MFAVIPRTCKEGKIPPIRSPLICLAADLGFLALTKDQGIGKGHPNASQDALRGLNPFYGPRIGLLASGD